MSDPHQLEEAGHTQWCVLEAGATTSSECTTLGPPVQRWHNTSVIVDEKKQALPMIAVISTNCFLSLAARMLVSLSRASTAHWPQFLKQGQPLPMNTALELPENYSNHWNSIGSSGRVAAGFHAFEVSEGCRCIRHNQFRTCALQVLEQRLYKP